MLDQLDAQSPDALLALIKMHAQDPREVKSDLGVGVYRTNDGATPVFRAIKAAEQKLVDTQDSKSYLGPEGDTGFVDALKPYIFGKDAAMGGRLEGMQTPGGTGAVRLAVALSKAAARVAADGSTMAAGSSANGGECAPLCSSRGDGGVADCPRCCCRPPLFGEITPGDVTAA